MSVWVGIILCLCDYITLDRPYAAQLIIACDKFVNGAPVRVGMRVNACGCSSTIDGPECVNVE